MKHVLFYSILFVLFGCSHSLQKNTTQSEEEAVDWAIIIHGGAGNFYNKNIDATLKTQFETSLFEALSIGESILKEGGSSLDAVEASISYLESDSLFNAGKGAVLTSEGTAELDASIMQGSDLNAGAVAGVTTIKHPIQAARKVMENSPHVMLAGKGAEQFSIDEDLEQVDNDYFRIQSKINAFENKKATEISDEKMGTVGCVAIDKAGNIVAGTSTGGMFYKKWGRIGDSPIIGAGTYANNESCGVSATGWGEYFIRGTVARDIAALMEMKGLSLQEAGDEIILNKLPKIGNGEGKGGVILIDKNGNIAYSYNTVGMLYVFSNAKGKRKFGLYK